MDPGCEAPAMARLAHRTGFRLRPWQRVLLVLVMAVLALQFFWRGPIRAVERSVDWETIYISTLAWRVDGNPYDHDLTRRLMAAHVDPARSDPATTMDASLYPPMSYALYAPLTLMSWPSAKFAFIALNLATTAALMALLGPLAGFARPDDRRWLLLAAMLAWAPLHTSLALGQTSLLAFALVVGSEIAARRDKQFLDGLLMGLALVVKVHVAAPFVLWMLFRGRWKAVLGAGCVVLLFMVAGAGRMVMAGYTSPISLWLHNVQVYSAVGAKGSVAHPHAYQFINLSYLLFRLFGYPERVSLVAKILVLAVMLLALWGVRRNGNGRADTAGFAALSALALLPTHHRFYDAITLIAAVAWVVSHVSEGHRPCWCGWVAAAALVTMLVPGASLLAVMARQGMIPAAIIDSWWWQAVLLPHQVWAISVIALAAVAAIFGETARLSPRGAIDRLPRS